MSLAPAAFCTNHKLRCFLCLQGLYVRSTAAGPPERGEQQKEPHSEVEPISGRMLHGAQAGEADAIHEQSLQSPCLNDWYLPDQLLASCNATRPV